MPGQGAVHCEAGAENLRRIAVAEQQDRNRRAGDAALDNSPAEEHPLQLGGADMYAATAALTFDQPILAIARRIETDLRMRNIEIPAKRREAARVFGARDGLRIIAEDAKMLRQNFKNVVAVFEPAAVDEARRRRRRRQRVQMRKQRVRFEAARRIGDLRRRRRQRPRIAIAKKIDDPRFIT